MASWRKLPMRPTKTDNDITKEDKICYINDILGGLFKELDILRIENQQIKSVIRPLIHMKHMFLFWKYKFTATEKEPSKHFNSDFDLCLKSLLKETVASKCFDFVRQQEVLYGSHRVYCDYNRVISESKEEDPVDTPLRNLAKEFQTRKDFPNQSNRLQNSRSDSGSRPVRQAAKKRKVGETDESDTEESSIEWSSDEEEEESNPTTNVPKATQQTKIKVNQKVCKFLKTELKIHPKASIKLPLPETKIVKATGQIIQTDDYTVNVGFLYKTSFDISLFYKILVLKPGESAFQYQCMVPECGYRSSFQPMKSHILEHLNMLPFKCYECPFSTPYISTLLSHLEDIHQSKFDTRLFNHRDFFQITGSRYQCKLGSCKFQSNNFASLAEHIEWHLTKFPFKCQYCQLRFGSLQDCDQHLFDEHELESEEEFQKLERSCPHRCGFESENLVLSDLIEHFKVKHSFVDQVIAKGKLIQRTDDKLDLEVQVPKTAMCYIRKREAGKRPFKEKYYCPYEDCEWYTLNAYKKERIESHLKNQHPLDEFGNRKPFPCLFDQCQQTFLSNELLEKHLDDAHIGDNYCKACDKQFDHRKNVRKHYQTSHRRIDVTCPVEGCGFRSKLRSDEKIHKRTHQDAMQCTYEGCSQICSTKFTLLLHVARVHERQQNEKCSWPGCGKRFFLRKDLILHARIHVSMKRYRCKWPDCSYASEQRTNVAKHVRIRHLKIPYTRAEQRKQNVPDELFEKAGEYVETLPEDIEL